MSLNRETAKDTHRDVDGEATQSRGAKLGKKRPLYEIVLTEELGYMA